MEGWVKRMRAAICGIGRLGKLKASSEVCVWRTLWEVDDRYGLEFEEPQRVIMVKRREPPVSW